MQEDFKFDVGEMVIVDNDGVKAPVEIVYRERRPRAYGYGSCFFYTVAVKRKTWLGAKYFRKVFAESELKEITGEELEAMSIVSRIKNLSMPDDDRLLRKHKLVDDAGDPTEQGKAALWILLLNENKAALAEQLRKIEAEDKKKSKKDA